MVAYDKSKNATEVDLNVRAYNPSLQLLWETQLIKSDSGGPPGYFRIVAVSGDKFFVGVVFNGGKLVIAKCTSDGKLVEHWNFEKIVGPYGGLHLAELDKSLCNFWNSIIWKFTKCQNYDFGISNKITT